MFSMSSIKDRSEFKYWFERIGATDTWNVYDINPGDGSDIVTLGVYDETTFRFEKMDVSNDTIVSQFDAISSDFLMFVNGRPEYVVGKHIPSELIDGTIPNTAHIEDMRVMYNSIIYGVSYLINKDDVVAQKYADRCIKWLESTDFYIAPASTVYHDAEPCGLLKHSLRVIDKMVELLHIPSFSNVNIAEAILTALAHDWCKIDFYEQYMKNVKDDVTGVWTKVPSYKCKGSNLPFGHGVTSLFIVQKFFKLTTEQALAIRWHMGRWNACDKELVDLCDANERYPLVHLLQFADQLSMTAYC